MWRKLYPLVQARLNLVYDFSCRQHCLHMFSFHRESLAARERRKQSTQPSSLNLLYLFSRNSQVLPALKTQEEKLRQQLLGQRQEVQELEMNIEAMSIEIREPPNLGNSKVVCGHCHHCSHRNNITKPCELKKCTEYTYCGLKEKHPEYFSKLNSLKVGLKKKKTTLKEIKSQIKLMEDFSTSSEFSFVKNPTHMIATKQDVLNMIIWNNQNLLINKKSIYNKRIKEAGFVKLGDILSANDSKLKKWDAFRE